MKRLCLLAAALLFLVPGCAKRADYSMAPPESAGYGGGSGMADMPTAAPAMAEAESYRNMDDAEADMPRDEAPAEPNRGNFGAPPAPPKQAPPGGAKDSGGKPTTTPGSEGSEEGKDPPKQFARQIIYVAEMAISVFKLDEAMKRAEALTLETGGYVQTMQQGYFILRIPAAQLRGVMDELGKLGVVETRNLQAQDVTQEYVDLSTRIRVLKETQSQLIALLKQARNVEEALKVRQSLDAITMELERAVGRMRMLENQIGFSTLTLRLSQRGPQNAVPSSNDPFPWVDTLGVEATEWN